MVTPSPLMRSLARRMLAGGQTASGPPGQDAGAVMARLKVALTRLAGTDGFLTLLRRARALAGEGSPGLRGVTISADGRLEGPERADAGGEAAVAITSHLLELLVTFIGEPLTLKLVGEAWPDMTLDEERERTEGES